MVLMPTSNQHVSLEASFFTAVSLILIALSLMRWLQKNADFHATKYSNGVGFFRTNFSGQANFARSRFIADSIFSQANFNDMAIFSISNFDGPVFFNDSVFCNDASFDNAQFQAPTDISYAAFKGNIKMNSTKIARMVLDGSALQAMGLACIWPKQISTG